jgi:SAM-dependent methyltransferase
MDIGTRSQCARPPAVGGRSAGERCIVCEQGDIALFLEIERVPILCGRLCRSLSAARRIPTARMRLAFCRGCGHVFNSEFDAGVLEYNSEYENALHYSAHFRDYENALVDELIRRYELRNRTVVEIGCGDGEFLETLCRRGGNRGFGFDPSHAPDGYGGRRDGNVVISREYYGSKHAALHADLICSRHTLEHIAEPRQFLTSIRQSTGRSGVAVFFEVPNALYTLRDGGIWDLIYEHCSYFTPTSLERVFSESGYVPLGVAEAYGGQFLTIHASMTEEACDGNHEMDVTELAAQVDTFTGKYHSKIDEWKRRLAEYEKKRCKVVVWGAGAKGTTFLNVLQPSAIEYVVDVNERKQGNYTPGTGQQIVAPQFLTDYRPEIVIVMNPVYVEEIRRIAGELGVEAEFLCA